MKKSIFIGLCWVALGCAQNHPTAMNIDAYVLPEAQHITAANFVTELNQKIQRYANEPVYYFRIYKQNCLVEVYENDIRDYKDYTLSNTITPIEIGHILKSGPQQITIKMLPLGNVRNYNLGLDQAEPETTLAADAQVQISIIRVNNQSAQGFEDEVLITEQLSPSDIAGKPYYNFTFTFNAEVPYAFEGWTKGQNLQKLDQDLVLKKAVEFYKMVGQLYQTKSLDAILKLDYPATVRVSQNFYYDAAYLQEMLDETKEKLTRDYTAVTIDDFTLDYMGNGKLLRLTSTSLKKGYRGYGALHLHYGKGGVLMPGITLYLPEGRDLATQGFTMWR